MTSSAIQMSRALSTVKAGPSGLLQRQCQCGAKTSSLSGNCRNCDKNRLQAKLTVGASNDASEQEADRVAGEVMQGPETDRASTIGPIVQRSGVQADGSGPIAPPSVDAVLAGAGQPLDASNRAFFETRFGHDFSMVRVHSGAAAERSAFDVGARAYTVGQSLVFGAGQFAPGTQEGRRLIAHELTHVVQQRGGGDVRQSHAGKAATVSPPATGMRLQRSPDDERFMAWWKAITGLEGSLKDWKKNSGNKDDKGGETNFGVTKKYYLANAKGLGLPATDEGFAAMSAEQAMLFGRMLWRASGAAKLKDTGVGLVLADWYWGGIDLKRLVDLLEARGLPKKKDYRLNFDRGSPNEALIAFMNTLPPGELAELMSDAKAGQYNAIAANDPTQRKFLKGWLERNELRRGQAQRLPGSAKSAESQETAKPDDLRAREAELLAEIEKLETTSWIDEQAAADRHSALENELAEVRAKLKRLAPKAAP